MIVRKSDHSTELRCAAHGGSGAVAVEHLAGPEQTFGHCRMAVRAVLDPGSSMGYHVHRGEMEFFCLLSGALEVDDNGTPAVLYPGDTMLTAEGEGHSLRCLGSAPAEYLAVVVRK